MPCLSPMLFLYLIKSSFSQTDRNDWVGEQRRWKCERKKKGVKWARKKFHPAIHLSQTSICVFETITDFNLCIWNNMPSPLQQKMRVLSILLTIIYPGFSTVPDNKNKTLLSTLVNLGWIFCIIVNYYPNWTSNSLLFF